MLNVFRVRLHEYTESQSKNRKTTILLQHGSAGSSDEFFVNGEEKSIGFYLVNKGYDVWAINNRGNKYSHSSSDIHMTLEKFFDFTFQDMAIYDIAAVFVYIKNSKDFVGRITLIGFSQGTQTFFASLVDPMVKELAYKYTKKFIALAPIAHMKGFGSQFGLNKLLSKAHKI